MNTMRLKQFVALWLGVAAAMPSAWAQVTIGDPWVKATVGGQTATAVYMTITTDKAYKITGVQSPAAGVAEIHQMTMEANDRMVMRSMPTLDLGAGQTIELKPGGLHLMLMDLRQKPLKVGDTVSLTLTLQSPDGKTVQQAVSASVRPLAGGGQQHHHHHHH